MSTEISSKEANILRACLNEWHDASEFDSASVAYLIHKNRKYLLVEQKLLFQPTSNQGIGQKSKHLHLANVP